MSENKSPSASLVVSVSDIEQAASRLAGVSVLTPLLCHQLESGVKLYLKAETFQIGGSFKFRGAYNRLAALSPEERARGVVAGSTGNHAQGIGHAAKRLGMKALIVMPFDAPQIKIDNTRALGCEIVFYDRMKDDRDAMAAQIAAERKCVFVPPYDDAYVIAGQGTIGREILAQMAEPLDAVLICCGGGGLSAGIATYVKAKSPSTQIVVVEPEGYDDTVRSLALGHRVSIAPDARSFADAISTKMPGALTFPIHQALGTTGCCVTDDETAEAMRYAFNKLKLVLEPGGAVALAAVLSGRYPTTRDSRIGIVLSGGNVDASLFSKVILNQPWG